jgi:copper chaperone CopZ
MKKTYKIEIDCANCAAKVEEAAKKIDGVKDVSINFVLQKMTVEFEDGADPKAVMSALVKAAKKVESDFEIEL